MIFRCSRHVRRNFQLFSAIMLRKSKITLCRHDETLSGGIRLGRRKKKSILITTSKRGRKSIDRSYYHKLIGTEPAAVGRENDYRKLISPLRPARNVLCKKRRTAYIAVYHRGIEERKRRVISKCPAIIKFYGRGM